MERHYTHRQSHRRDYKYKLVQPTHTSNYMNYSHVTLTWPMVLLLVLVTCTASCISGACVQLQECHLADLWLKQYTPHVLAWCTITVKLCALQLITKHYIIVLHCTPSPEGRTSGSGQMNGLAASKNSDGCNTFHKVQHDHNCSAIVP